jgi:hypothetical protein
LAAKSSSFKSSKLHILKRSDYVAVPRQNSIGLDLHGFLPVRTAA